MNDKRRGGFTLVEMLIVIIVIGVLAGLMMISAGSATDNASKTRCIADRRQIKSALNLYRAEHGSYDGFGEEQLKGMFDNFHGAVTSGEISGVCPNKGVYTIDVINEKMTIYCNIHDVSEADGYYTSEEIKTMFDKLKETGTFIKRYSNNKNTGEQGSLDSNGSNSGNFGTAVELMNDLGIDLSNYSWRLIVWGSGNYDIYLTKDKFDNTAAVGTKITVDKYSFNTDGKIIEVRSGISGTIEEKVVDKNTGAKIKVIGQIKSA